MAKRDVALVAPPGSRLSWSALLAVCMAALVGSSILYAVAVSTQSRINRQKMADSKEYERYVRNWATRVERQCHEDVKCRANHTSLQAVSMSMPLDRGFTLNDRSRVQRDLVYTLSPMAQEEWARATLGTALLDSPSGERRKRP